MIANDRRHMASLLDDRMNMSPRLADAVSGGAKKSTHIKTYFVETTQDEAASPTRTKDFLGSVLNRPDAGRLDLNISSKDTVASVQTAVKDELLTIYIDFTNPRFWRLHSMGDSPLLDRVVYRWTNDIPELDRAWFPISFMEQCISLGEFRGFAFDYDKRWLTANSEPGDSVSLQVRTKLAQTWLDATRSEKTRHQTPLSKITVNTAHRHTNDIKYDGKITTKGKSFSDHLSLANSLYETYSSKVKEIEQRYALCAWCSLVRCWRTDHISLSNADRGCCRFL